MEALKRILNHMDWYLKQIRKALSDEDLTEAEKSSLRGAERATVGFMEVIECEIKSQNTSQKGKKK